MIKKSEYTYQERHAIWKVIHDLNACPNCFSINTMLEGPHGAGAINITCKDCKQTFCVDPLGSFGAYPL